MSEILLGEEVESFGVDGVEQTLYCHEKCKPKLVEMTERQDWQVLPDGPLRSFYEEHQDKIVTS